MGSGQVGAAGRWSDEEGIELERVQAGIRRPPEWKSRRATAGVKHGGSLCHGCHERVTVAERIIIERDLNCAIEARRYRYWHSACHPRAVERAWNALRRQYMKVGRAAL